MGERGDYSAAHVSATELLISLFNSLCDPPWRPCCHCVLSIEVVWKRLLAVKCPFLISFSPSLCVYIIICVQLYVFITI